jgi:hypothetical protein
MIRRHTRRPGTSLMEVLIAMGILAIGMLAIMALFPIGAVNMARAINQNRAAEAGTNSDAMFRYYWKNAWVDRLNGGGLRALDGTWVPQPAPNPPVRVQGASDIEPMMLWLDCVPSPVTGLPVDPVTGFPNRAIPTTSAQPSFPVLVDPVGYLTQTPAPPPTVSYQNYIASNNQLPRRTTLAAAAAGPNPTRATVRLTTLLDDMSYDGNGEPASYTGQLERGGRYNVAWLMQRPKNNVPHEVHLTVLVYAGRSPTDTPSSETAFPAVATDYYANVDPKPKSLTVSLIVNGNPQPRPPLMAGKWVAFSTPIQPQPAPPTPGAGVAYPAFDFYRIAAVQDVDATTLTLELEQPLRTYDTTTLVNHSNPAAVPPAPATLSGSVVVFDNLFEVFDRGLVSAATIAGR